MCGEPIEDGDNIVEGQHGTAVVREEEHGFRGEVEYGSEITSIHVDCLDEERATIEEVME
jgi:hypothetical protein